MLSLVDIISDGRGTVQPGNSILCDIKITPDPYFADKIVD